MYAEKRPGKDINVPKKTTYQDIANYTGFSKTTISRYFNRPETVTEENQQKIRHALEVLDYQGNKVARILASGRTEFIGLIVPNLYFSFYGEMMERFLKSYDRYGYKFIVFGGGSEELERQYINELRSYHVEGLIVLSHTIPSFELASYGIPLVAIERDDLYINSVNTDNRAGGAAAAQLLCDCDCDVLIHINKGGDDFRIPAHDRIEGFLDVCEERRIPHEIRLYEPEHSYEDLVEQITRILESIIADWPGKRKGLFCSSDTIANSVLNELFRRFGRLPDDFRIVGFDGCSISRRSVLPLSTVEQQLDLLVEGAMDLLIEQIRLHKETGSDLPAGSDSVSSDAVDGSGASGAAGASGTNGSSGPAGASGSVGTSGAAGASGTSVRLREPRHRVVAPILRPRATT